jgi:hypothetical protein
MATAVFFTRPSKSGVRLAKALGATVIKSFDKLAAFCEINKEVTILNWGVGIRDEWDAFTCSNKVKIFGLPNYISCYINKRDFNSMYSGLVAPVIDHHRPTFKPLASKEYVGRKTMVGSGGKGIFFFKKTPEDKVGIYDFDSRSYSEIEMEDFKDSIRFAKSVCQYVPKTHEYRYYVGQEGIIHVIEKRKGKETNLENAAPELPMAGHLRNHTNGYVFCQNDLERNDKLHKVTEFVEKNLVPKVKTQPIWMVAFDVGFHYDNETICVYEGNTAPGLTSDITFSKVIEYVERLLNNKLNVPEVKTPKIPKGAFSTISPVYISITPDMLLEQLMSADEVHTACIETLPDFED